MWMKLIYVGDVKEVKVYYVDERGSCSWGNTLRREPERRMTTIRISCPKLRKQSRSSVSFDIMPKTATYNQCYLVFFFRARCLSAGLRS